MSNSATGLDELDHRLIELLRTNARLPVAKLAAQLGVSRATVTARMERLEQSGVIAGYTIVVPTQGRHDAVRAIAMLAIDGSVQQIVRRLAGFPEDPKPPYDQRALGPRRRGGDRDARRLRRAAAEDQADRRDREQRDEHPALGPEGTRLARVCQGRGQLLGDDVEFLGAADADADVAVEAGAMACARRRRGDQGLQTPAA